VAVQAHRFELDAARLTVQLDVRTVRSADEARATVQQLGRAGVSGIVADWPAAWLVAAAQGLRLPLINAGESADALRDQTCSAPVFHTLPSERMRADALAQALQARRWLRVLLLQGPGTDDAERGARAQAAIKRYGLRLAGVKAFKISGDPRERDLANPLLLTGPAVGEYDAVWVVDSEGEFARSLPYRTSLPRPVVGDAGLMADAWAPRFDRYGAPQLARRFARAAQRPMSGIDWAAYVAAKALLQAALDAPSDASAAALLKALQKPDFALDGVKGVRLSFRAWDHQLRQPLLLTDGLSTIGSAPVDGVMHPKNVLDTLGADAPESPCKVAM
jgi:ABC transporter substrate binding protein (PQQ-dependent alcohol dehydrogenase system)